MTDLSAFRDQLARLMTEEGITYTHNPYLSEECHTDLVFYRENPNRRLQLFVTLAEANDPNKRLTTFSAWPPPRNKLGTIRKLGIILEEDATPADALRTIKEALVRDPSRDPPYREVRIGTIPFKGSGTKALETVLPFGLRMEDELARELASLGFTVRRNEELDHGEKVDILLTACNGIRSFRTLAVQVTMRRDDLLKLQAYRRRSGVTIERPEVQRLYIQYSARVSVRELAALIFGHAVSRIARDLLTRSVFMEIDEEGGRLFNAYVRIANLRRQANPRTSAAERVEGTIENVFGNTIVITSENGRHWGHPSSIVDRFLLQVLQGHNNSTIDARGTKVSFIPGGPYNGNHDRPSAMSIRANKG